MTLDDTIVALATPIGKSAIAVIRISGERAIPIVKSVFHGPNLSKVASHSATYGHIKNPSTQEIIDEVMLTVLLAPRTFTCEDSIEISCHGSMYVVKKILEVLVKAGCRYATEGEFTKRAFINGRIDLAQAEAVADIIAADTQAQHAIAINNLRSGITTDLQSLRTQLVDFAALLELELDFSEEDVAFADRSKLQELLQHCTLHLQELANTFQYGNAIKQGIHVVIAGSPNAGKSTLLNSLINDDRALVSDIAGTTRDTIEELLNMEGLLFRFVDTAGLRENTLDVIEKMGMIKTETEIKKATLLLYLFDATTPVVHALEQDIAKYKTPHLKIIIVANKIDLLAQMQATEVLQQLQKTGESYVMISAKSKINIDALKKNMIDFVSEKAPPTNQTIVYNERHSQELHHAIASLEQVKSAFEIGTPTDLIAIDLRKTLYHIGCITGEVDIDKDILGSIFSKFCIGK